MERFRAGGINALVATTVIEVGVDVPNASVMVIESAERFGLAQLHQLRGRIGRGARRSVCVLISDGQTPDALERLKAVAATTDGFALAEKDFSLRGFGAVAGAAQSGTHGLKVADLSRDVDLLKLARKDAAEWVSVSPDLGRPEDSLIRRRLWKAHGEAIALAKVG
jgi:ATP-dependent DNA helicase RecG